MPDTHQDQGILRLCRVLPCSWPGGQQGEVPPPNGDSEVLLIKLEVSQKYLPHVLISPRSHHIRDVWRVTHWHLEELYGSESKNAI